MSGNGYDYPLGGGGGGTNPTSTYLPVNNAGTFADSLLFQAAAGQLQAANGLRLDIPGLSFKFGGFAAGAWYIDAEADNLYSVNKAGNSEGLLFITGATNRAFYFGDYDGNTHGASVKFDNNGVNFGQSMHSGGALPGGLFLQTLEANAYLGDYTNRLNGTSWNVNDNSQSIYAGIAGLQDGFLLSNAGVTHPNLILGDVTNRYGGIALSIIGDDTSMFTGVVGGSVQGFSLNLTTAQYFFGDYNTNFLVDGPLIQAYTNINGARFGLLVATGISYLGDFDNISLGTFITVQDNRIFSTNNGGNVIGFDFDFSNQFYSIGDPNGVSGGTYFAVDDLNKQLAASANVLAGTAGLPAGQYIKITIGGTQYKIALLNP